MIFELNDLRTTREVSKMLNCTVRNISKLVQEKKIKPIKILENETFLFDVNEITEFIRVKQPRKKQGK